MRVLNWWACMHINKYFVYILYTVLIEICGDGGGSKNKYFWSFNYGEGVSYWADFLFYEFCLFT